MIAREPLRRQIATIGPTIRACYERSTAMGSEARVSVRFVIDGEGRVACAEVTQSDSGDAALDQCVSEAVAGLRFPAYGGAVITVHYPFRFAP